jgi:hypothetical protein
MLSPWQHEGIIESFDLAIPWWYETKIPQPGIGPLPPILPNGTIPSNNGNEKMFNFSI